MEQSGRPLVVLKLSFGFLLFFSVFQTLKLADSREISNKRLLSPVQCLVQMDHTYTEPQKLLEYIKVFEGGEGVF